MPAWVMLGLGVASFAGACVLRLRWRGLSAPAQRWTLWLTLVPVMALFCSLLTGWKLAHPVVQQVWELVALCAYTFLALLVSLRKPRALSGLGSAMLLMPALVFLVLTPLKPLLQTDGRTDDVAPGLVARRVVLEGGEPSLVLYSRPEWFPGVERELGRVDFEGARCNVFEARVTLAPSGRLARVQCPLPGGKAQEYRVRLR